MKSTMRHCLFAGLMAALTAIAVSAQSAATGPDSPVPTTPIDNASLRTLLELARSDIKITKAAVIAMNLPLSDDEAAEFWPVHREYETELSKLGDQKLALIGRFFAGSEKLSDEEMNELVKDTFDLEVERTELKRKYYVKFCEVVPPAKAARFFQIEGQINAVIELQVAAALPLIK